MEKKIIPFFGRKITANKDQNIVPETQEVQHDLQEPGQGVFCQGQVLKIIDVSTGNLQVTFDTLGALEKAGLPLSLAARGLEQGHGNKIEITPIKTQLQSVDPSAAVYQANGRVGGYQIEDINGILNERLLPSGSIDQQNTLVEVENLPARLSKPEKFITVVVAEEKKIISFPQSETTISSQEEGFLGNAPINILDYKKAA